MGNCSACEDNHEHEYNMEVNIDKKLKMKSK